MVGRGATMCACVSNAHGRSIRVIVAGSQARDRGRRGVHEHACSRHTGAVPVAVPQQQTLQAQTMRPSTVPVLCRMYAYHAQGCTKHEST